MIAAAAAIGDMLERGLKIEWCCWVSKVGFGMSPEVEAGSWNMDLGILLRVGAAAGGSAAWWLRSSVQEVARGTDG